jgi:hypothetical protein
MKKADGKILANTRKPSAPTEKLYCFRRCGVFSGDLTELIILQILDIDKRYPSML